MQTSFDIIIVGAGSAGCVLANRLSRDPNAQVLLLEAGGWDWNPLISIPPGARKMTQHNLYNWDDVSEPDPGLDRRRLAIAHGRVIGGSSSINYMAHSRGHPNDYDRWAAQGCAGWGYADVLPYFKQTETWERGADAWRGGRGELGARETGGHDPIYDAWLRAARGLGYELTRDYNGEKPNGFGLAQYTLRDGRRCSSAYAFLRPALKRPNLTVWTRAHVTRLLFEGTKVVGVEYAMKGRRQVVHASERVALSLGAINTPHLLMLSGVGPADHLKSMSVTPVADLPVGKGLQDHLGIATYWTRKAPGHFHQSLRFDRIALSMLRAYVLRRGSASELPGVVFGYVKTRAEAQQPDLQMVVNLAPFNADYWFPGVKPAYQDGFGIRTQLTGQQSRGEILLRSADPRERPRVFYNSLSEPRDLEIMREGFKRTWALGNTPELAEFRGAPTLPDRELKTDAEIDAFIRETAIQLYHPGCTCQMGTGPEAVVDPELNVRGLQNLSIVDASVMPHMVSGNPNAPIMMMAAKAAAIWTGEDRSVRRVAPTNPMRGVGPQSGNIAI